MITDCLATKASDAISCDLAGVFGNLRLSLFSIRITLRINCLQIGRNEVQMCKAVAHFGSSSVSSDSLAAGLER